MGKWRSGLAIILALTVASSVAFALGESYPIKLKRGNRAGDVYDSHAQLEQTQESTVTAPGATPQTERRALKGDLSVRVEVNQVDDTGSSKLLTLTIQKLTDPAGNDLIAPGKVLKVKRGETETTFTVEGGGGNISPEAKAILTMSYPPLKPHKVTDDDIFGSKTPRQVGEKWPVNSEAWAKDMSGDGLVVDAKTLTGEVTLQSLVLDLDFTGLRISADLDAKDVKPPVPDAKLTLDSCTLHGNFEGLFPIDPNAPARESSMTMDMNMLTSVKDSATKVNFKMHVAQKEKITMIKKGPQ